MVKLSMSALICVALKSSQTEQGREYEIDRTMKHFLFLYLQ